MLNPEFITFLQTLLDLTNKQLLKLDKGDSALSYLAKPIDQTFLIDKYYSVEGSEQYTCINFTVFSKDDNSIVSEVVLCKPEDNDGHFELLNNLYKSVELQYQKEQNEKLSHVFSDITQSLQEKLQTH